MVRCFVLVLALMPFYALYAQDTSSVLSTWGDDESIKLWGWGDPDGKMYDYKASREVIAKVPEWLPDKSDAPLRIPDAVAIAKKTARNDFPKYTDFLLTGFMINQVPSQKYRNRWFYVVELYPELDGDPQIESQVTVLILMDGTVIKPIERKKGQR